MNAHTDFTATLSQMSEGTARIARIASESQAECERISEENKRLRRALKGFVNLIDGGIQSQTLKFPAWVGIHLNEAINEARQTLKG